MPVGVFAFGVVLSGIFAPGNVVLSEMQLPDETKIVKTPMAVVGGLG